MLKKRLIMENTELTGTAPYDVVVTRDHGRGNIEDIDYQLVHADNGSTIRDQLLTQLPDNAESYPGIGRDCHLIDVGDITYLIAPHGEED